MEVLHDGVGRNILATQSPESNVDLFFVAVLQSGRAPRWPDHRRPAAAERALPHVAQRQRHPGATGPGP